MSETPSQWAWNAPASGNRGSVVHVVGNRLLNAQIARAATHYAGQDG